MAADGIAIIGLGFVVSRFGLFLRAIAHPPAGPAAPPGSAGIGVGLVVLGGLSVLGAAWQHVRFCRGLSASERPPGYWSGFALWVSLSVAAAAVVLAAYRSWRDDPNPSTKSGLTCGRSPAFPRDHPRTRLVDPRPNLRKTPPRRLSRTAKINPARVRRRCGLQFP